MFSRFNNFSISFFPLVWFYIFTSMCVSFVDFSMISVFDYLLIRVLLRLHPVAVVIPHKEYDTKGRVTGFNCVHGPTGSLTNYGSIRWEIFSSRFSTIRELSNRISELLGLKKLIWVTVNPSTYIIVAFYADK